METLSDSDLIKSIKKKKKVDECLQELIDRHSGIYLDIVNSFLRNCNNDSLREEIINDKEYAIYNSVLKYDENRGTKFSTFLGNEAKWMCLNASNKNKKYLELNDHSFDFSELKPRGHYTSSNEMQTYFRAFKYFTSIFNLKPQMGKKACPKRKKYGRIKTPKLRI